MEVPDSQTPLYFDCCRARCFNKLFGEFGGRRRFQLLGVQDSSLWGYNRFVCELQGPKAVRETNSGRPVVRHMAVQTTAAPTVAVPDLAGLLLNLAAGTSCCYDYPCRKWCSRDSNGKTNRVCKRCCQDFDWPPPAAATLIQAGCWVK